MGHDRTAPFGLLSWRNELIKISIETPVPDHRNLEKEDGGETMSRSFMTVVLPSLILGAATAGASVLGTEIYVPSVAEAPGVHGSQWYTTVWVHNPNEESASVRVSFLRRNQANPSPPATSFILQPDATIEAESALSTWFGNNNAVGAFRFQSDRPIAVSARIYNQPGSDIRDSQGQLLAGYPVQLALGAGASTTVPGVDQGDDGAFRTNFGLVEVTGAPASVDVSLLDEDGRILATRRYHVEGFEPIQVNLEDLGAGATPTRNGALRFAVTPDSDGRIIPFASLVANGQQSQDPSTLEMELDLAGGGDGLDRVHHDGTLTGDGTLTSPLGLADGAVTTEKMSDAGASPGQVLKASGGTVRWAGDGLEIPWAGSGSSDGALFTLTQSGGGAAMELVASSGFGLHAEGFLAAATFTNTSAGNSALLAPPGYGIQAFGTEAAGTFESNAGSGSASLGTGDVGIQARGGVAAGQFFKDTGPTQVQLCINEPSNATGISAIATGIAGSFWNTSYSDGADLGTSSGYGVHARGTAAGGLFETGSGDGSAHLAYQNYGVWAFGSNAGGYFGHAGGAEYALIGTDDYGIQATGQNTGGYFSNNTASGRAWAARQGWGVFATGNWMGAQFEDGDDGTKSYLAFGSETVAGTGSKSFVQNDPEDPASVIVYSALEGPEVGTYTRGTAILNGTRVVIPLDPTFRKVTNPDIGLTATVTPRGPNPGLYVEQIGTEELIVASPEPVRDLVFDYLVMGLRIGFEEVPVVRPRLEDAPIPSMSRIRRLVATNPESAASTPLARFTTVETSLGHTPDLARSERLAAAIGRFRRDHGTTTAPESSGSVPALVPVEEPDAPVGDRSSPLPGDAPGTGTPSGVPPVPQDRVLVRVAWNTSLPAGSVVALDPGSHRFVPATADLAGSVVGVAASPPDAGAPESEALLLAVAGLVRCRVDAGYGAVLPGDLLAASPTPGHAMRVSDPMPGTVVAKALEPLASGTGTILAIVMLR